MKVSSRASASANRLLGRDLGGGKGTGRALSRDTTRVLWSDAQWANSAKAVAGPKAKSSTPPAWCVGPGGVKWASETSGKSTPNKHDVHEPFVQSQTLVWVANTFL